jgi:hypothetical protein
VYSVDGIEVPLMSKRNPRLRKITGIVMDGVIERNVESYTNNSTGYWCSAVCLFSI